MVNQTKIEGWNTNNLTNVQLIPQGLAISTETTGQLIRKSSIKHDVQQIGITYISPTGASGIFFWRPPGMDDDNVMQIPINFAPTTSSTKIVLDMSRIKQWDARSDYIGFVIEGGSQLILQKVEFSGSGVLESVYYSLKTFFRFDRLRPYSINFLWGPQMTYSKDQMNNLFSQVPPSGDSWNTALYILLAILLAGALLWKRMRGGKPFTWFFLVFAVLWVLYDLRMGAEIMSYAKADLRTWWTQPIAQSQYRDRGDFAAFAQLAAPYTQGKDRYVLAASHGWPFTGAMQYATYPAQPVPPDGDTEGIDTWIVYNRRDIALDEQSRLSLNGQVLSPPGDILMRFSPVSFVFLTRP